MSEATPSAIRVLHVDDNPDITEVVALHLERTHEAIEVLDETSARRGLERIRDPEERIDCVVSDHDMPGMDGLEFLRAVREFDADLPFILFTGKGSEEIASEAISAGVTEYLQKETGSHQYAVLANRIERAVGEERAKEALEESERMLSTLISNLPGMVYRCRNERGWPMEFVSEGCAELTGYPAAELESGEVVWGEEILLEEDREDMWERVQTAIDAREPFEVTYRIETADGEIRWMWERGSGVYEDGDLVALEGFITDITARKHRERELREQQEFVESLLDTLGDPFYLIDPRGNMVRWNDRFREVLGYADGEIADMTASDFVVDEHVDRLARSLEEVRQTGRTTVELDAVTTAGERIPFEVRGAAVYDAEDDFMGTVGIARDMSARLARERELEQYRTLVENVGDPMYVLNDAGRFEMVNEAMEQLSGWSEEEYLGEEPSPKFMREEDYQRGTEVLFDVFQRDDRQWGTFEFAPKSGDARGREMENMVAPLTDEEGAYRGAVGVIRDVSERKERERELMEYRTLVENVGDPMYVLDPDGTITMVNHAMEEHLGYPREEIEGAPPTKVMVEEDVAKGDRIVTGLLDNDDQQWASWEMRTVSADGTITLTENKTAVLRDADGTFIGSAGVIRDITDRKERERELERTETIIQAVDDPVYTLDDEGRFTFVNDAFESMTGYAVADLLDEHISEIVRESDIERGREAIREMIEGDRTTLTYEIEVRTGEGETIPSELHMAPLPFDEEFRGTAGIIRDIEERKEREERLEEFASVVSHDLRSPLNVILGRVELARETGDPEHLETVERAARRMNTLVEDLLALALQGQTVGETEPVDLETIATEAWDSVDTAEASLHVVGDGTLDADPDRFRELVENLFRNAVEHAGPAVTVTMEATSDGFAVADDGPGIPPEDREQVFEQGYTDHAEGTGFGLAIVRRIAEAHGWRVRPTESADGGARFEFVT